MADAKKDANRESTLIGVSSVDSTTPTLLLVDPATGRLLVSAITTAGAEYAEDAAHTTGDLGIMILGVRNDTPNVALAGTDLDYIATSHSKSGAIHVIDSEEDFAVLGSNKVNKTFNLTGAQTDAIIWSPAAGKRWYITDVHYVVSAAAVVTFEDDLVAGDSVVGIGGSYAANSGLSRSFKTPVFSGEDAADLILTTSAGNIQGIITGYEI